MQSSTLPIALKFFDHDADNTIFEKELFDAIEQADTPSIEKYLKLGVNINKIKPRNGESPLIFVVSKYIKTHEQKWLQIAKSLLDFNADIYCKHLYTDENSLTLAAKDNNCSELVHLLMKYRNKIECVIYKPEEATKVTLAAPENENMLAKTLLQLKDVNINVESFNTKKLSENYIENLFELYRLNFSNESEPTIELQRKHFNDKLALNVQENNTFIDVVKVNEKIVGFNIYTLYQGVFANKLYQVIYCGLSFIDKAYRGTRIMSLISFRAPFALKEANPHIETYIFYDAIHPNSYRLVWNLLPRYPECRTEESILFIRHFTSRIYGKERAMQYDGKDHFYWPTTAKVESPPIKISQYDLPCVIEKFDEITEGKDGVPGKGGVPVVLPIDDNNLRILAKSIDAKLLNPGAFEKHITEFANMAFAARTHEEWMNAAECLWPNNPVLKLTSNILKNCISENKWEKVVDDILLPMWEIQESTILNSPRIEGMKNNFEKLKGLIEDYEKILENRLVSDTLKTFNTIKNALKNDIDESLACLCNPIAKPNFDEIKKLNQNELILWLNCRNKALLEYSNMTDAQEKKTDTYIQKMKLLQMMLINIFLEKVSDIPLQKNASSPASVHKLGQFAHQTKDNDEVHQSEDVKYQPSIL